MNNRKYTWILYVIVAVIAATIAIQVYWNYKNYLTNKQQLINDVQLSLDTAIETYYAKLAQNETIAFAFDSGRSDSLGHQQIDSLLQQFEFPERVLKSFDSLNIEYDNGIAYMQIIDGDTIFKESHNGTFNRPHQQLRSINTDIAADSVTKYNFRTLTSRVIVSLTNDSLNLEAIDTLFSEQLKLKKIGVNFGLQYEELNRKTHVINKTIVETALLSSSSKSPYIHYGNVLSVHFTNPTKTILKRILSGILISTLLVLAVIGCLFYLLKVIKHQKQLSEVKNDLISNITHEFKTPIATIGVALESIKNFNVIDDKEKTKKYLSMSSDQLDKLNIMVEKLLETASLDSETLHLSKDSINIVELVESCTKKHQLQTETKSLQFITSDSEIIAEVDPFHFENAINNVIDNAIKYGGDKITITLEQNSFSFTVSISDNGDSISKANKDRIFEKFYRIAKGNTHDVKGFGIGLYYTKTIVEKHEGTIFLDINATTTFVISLPK
jgi:two-component system phosphate regulon sensor histidine kinase PhoR